ncbi:hypothetical protein DFR57_107134 [Saliterribacillus persicus]|uniref:Uncharacterized protein n=1 Tax=Saliterribacillus persicus TaxID=930114 RepID=A0A368XPF9_9BACI|nr:hypothetical protein DFR57_107134 [Saliterribacillus persicus]
MLLLILALLLSAITLNLFGLMHFIPMYVTIPVLFIASYLTICGLFYKQRSKLIKFR